MNNKLKIIICFFIFLLFILFYNNRTQNELIEITAENGTVFYAKVAKTDYERIKGLSNKANLPKNEGLLFIFNEEGFHGIWMKDMNFPIDIAWLNKDKRIIYIKENIEPDTFPTVFSPEKNIFNEKSLYVLEVNAGFFSEKNINVGEFLIF